MTSPTRTALPAWLPLACLGLATSLSACAPALVDGRYACPDGRCPSGWFCHADRVCRQAAPDAGPEPADGAQLDAAVEPLTPCTTDAECGALRCYRGPDDDWPTGRCSPACTMDRDCVSLPGTPACDTVGSDRCILLCDETDPSCPAALRCVAIYRDSRDPRSTLGECRPSDAPITVSSGAACTEDLDCGVEETCAEMRCARPCARGVLPCASGEECLPSMAGDVCRRAT
jgi:hypothetical protein